MLSRRSLLTVLGLAALALSAPRAEAARRPKWSPVKQLRQTVDGLRAQVAMAEGAQHWAPTDRLSGVVDHYLGGFDKAAGRAKAGATALTLLPAGRELRAELVQLQARAATARREATRGAGQRPAASPKRRARTGDGRDAQGFALPRDIPTTKGYPAPKDRKPYPGYYGSAVSDGELQQVHREISEEVLAFADDNNFALRDEIAHALRDAYAVGNSADEQSFPAPYLTGKFNDFNNSLSDRRAYREVLREMFGSGVHSELGLYEHQQFGPGHRPVVRGERYDRSGREWSVAVQFTDHRLTSEMPPGIAIYRTRRAAPRPGKTPHTQTLVTREMLREDGEHVIEAYQLDQFGVGDAAATHRTDISSRVVPPTPRASDILGPAE